MLIPAHIMRALVACQTPHGAPRAELLACIHYNADSRRFTSSNNHVMYTALLSPNVRGMPTMAIRGIDKIPKRAETCELTYGIDKPLLICTDLKGKELKTLPLQLDLNPRCPDFLRVIPKINTPEPCHINPDYLALTGECFSEDLSVRVVTNGLHKPVVITGAKLCDGWLTRQLIIMSMKEPS